MAGELQIGQHVLSASGTAGVVSAVETFPAPARLYDLTVEGAHTYFVGEGRWLVHNCAADVSYNLTRTVENHAATRPYIHSPLLVDMIMTSTKGIPDPGGVATALRWDVPGHYKGKEGTWQLVVDTATNTILHFNFVR